MQWAAATGVITDWELTVFNQDKQQTLISGFVFISLLVFQIVTKANTMLLTSIGHSERCVGQVKEETF